MTIVTQNEFRIHIDSLYAYKTYAGLIAGLPSKKVNDTIMKQIPNVMKKTFHSCKIHIVPPIIKLKKNRFPYLPSWIMAAQLHSAAVNEKADGSMLVLVWFSGNFPKFAEGELQQVMDGVDWKSAAQDFYF